MSPLTPQILANLPPRQQVDALRKALRGGTIDANQARASLADWIDTFDRNQEPGYQVLLLELLAPLAHPTIEALAHRALKARGDGVRLAGLRYLLDHDPGQLPNLDEQLHDDDSLEVRLLLAERLHNTQPTAAVDRLFAILSEEALGPRELHALERGVEFLVEETSVAGLRERLIELQDEVRDPEGFIAWGLEQLDARDRGTP